MSRLHTTALAVVLTLLPGLALADMVNLPRLDFPADTAGTVSQGCIQPGTLATPCQQDQ